MAVADGAAWLANPAGLRWFYGSDVPGTRPVRGVHSFSAPNCFPFQNLRNVGWSLLTRRRLSLWYEQRVTEW
jgi:hypothetical protein